MRVRILTVNFPVPSETFACVEFQSLKKLGVELSIRELGFANRSFDQMLEDYGLQDVDRSSQTIREFPWNCTILLRHPILAMELVLCIFSKLLLSPRQLIKSLILVPKSVAIFEEIRQDKPDVVHLFWGHYPALVAWLIDRYLPTQKWSIALNAYDLWMNYPVTLSILPRAGFIRVISQANARELQHAIAAISELLVIPHGIDLQTFRESSTERILYRFFSAGRLVPKKNFLSVLKAFARFHCEHPNATLVLAGDGPDRGILVEFVATNNLQNAVQFLGHLPQKRLADELAKSEVFLFLSEEEMLPNVVKEAMASGCICVVRRTPGIEELIESSDYGFVVDSDEQAIDCTRAIFRMTQEERCRMAARAIQFIAENYDMGNCASRLRTAWLDLMKR
jgi:glycosyltransferase involved in cell wall biosynthesis